MLAMLNHENARPIPFMADKATNLVYKVYHVISNKDLGH